MISVNKNEVIRYLGYRGITEPDEHLNALIDECIKELQEKAVPRSVYRTFPIIWREVTGTEGIGTERTSAEETSADKMCEFAGIKVSSGNLLKNLKGCSEIVMLAVTIGPQADMLVRRSEVRDMLKAYTYQAVGAAMVEAWCDEINDRIVNEARERGLYARPRFSPGYGDFPLEVQKDFEKILDMPKSIGVTLSDSLLMTPTKSVTAVIGLSDKNMDCHRGGCEECNMHDTCEYSR
ncbi:Vitamin B12 dependent methionine synthase, activation domain [Lachnospiraceae bacterium]|nr:Vitamin B12 dependent methionine synthase, activation domain [Lachnospiraceae bacterium]